MLGGEQGRRWPLNYVLETCPKYYYSAYLGMDDFSNVLFSVHANLQPASIKNLENKITHEEIKFIDRFTYHQSRIYFCAPRWEVFLSFPIWVSPCSIKSTWWSTSMNNIWSVHLRLFIRENLKIYGIFIISGEEPADHVSYFMGTPSIGQLLIAADAPILLLFAKTHFTNILNERYCFQK